MSRLVLIDTNLLLLLVVGRANPAYIDMHKRLRDDYTEAEYHDLESILAPFAGIAVVPHVLAEVSNLARYIREPARGRVLGAIEAFVAAAREFWVRGWDIVCTREFRLFGLTDAALLQLCSEDIEDVELTLLTADQPLAYHAQSLDYPVLLWE